MPKTYKWDKYAKEAKVKPFVIDGLPDWHPASGASGGPDSITVPVPDGEAFLKAEVAPSAGESLRLLTGEQWSSIEWLIMGGDPAADAEDRPGQSIPMPGVVEFVQDITRHFSLGEDNRPPGGGRR